MRRSELLQGIRDFLCTASDVDRRAKPGDDDETKYVKTRLGTGRAWTCPGDARLCRRETWMPGPSHWCPARVLPVREHGIDSTTEETFPNVFHRAEPMPCAISLPYSKTS